MYSASFQVWLTCHKQFPNTQMLLVSQNSVTLFTRPFYDDKISDKSSQTAKLCHYHYCYNSTSLQHTNKLAFENCFRLLKVSVRLIQYVICLHWITRRDGTQWKKKKNSPFFLAEGLSHLIICVLLTDSLDEPNAAKQ